MKKRFTAFIVSMVLVAAASPLAARITGGRIGTMNVVAAETYARSGRNAVAKLSWGQLATLYDSIPSYTNLYSKNPVVASNKYAAGSLSTDASTTALKSINYYRSVAGVGNITFSADLNSSASYGALVNAANNVLSHSPAQPAGMTKVMYDTSYYAASKSNISSAAGYSSSQIIPLAIKGQMTDASTSNLATVGHRRWLLNPNAVFMGIGSANNLTTYYTAIRVAGTGVSGSSVSDYNFIAWPASGNNLSETFSTNTPWSISLNPSIYSTPVKSKITITLTQCKNGQKWTFNGSTGTTNSSTANYFTVDTGGYGINNCLIFRPAYSNLSTYSGDYIVTVSGISTRAGAATSLSYKVSFDTRSHITAANDAAVANTTATTPASATRNNIILIPDYYCHAAAARVQTRKLAPAAYDNPTFTYSSNNRYITVNKTTGLVTISKNYVGHATITITASKTANYNAATKKISIVIYPNGTPIKKLKSSSKKTLTVSWPKNVYADGYQITYSTSSNFRSNSKNVMVSKKKLSYKIKKLSRKKVYYVKIRAYRIVNGTVYYGLSTPAKSCKVK